MGLSHTAVFRVRHYECDSYGHLNNTNYLRYALETALEAWGNAGFSLARLAALNRRWQSQAIDIEYLRPLRYGDTVAVRVTVAGFDGQIVRLITEFQRTGTAPELVARVAADAIFVEDESDRPAPVPIEMRQLLCDGNPDQEPLPPLESFPEAPPAPPGVFRLAQKVAWHDLDVTGQINEAAYLVYTEECGMGVVAAFGWPVARMTAEGFGILLRRHQIAYLQPAEPGDELEVATWASHVRRVMATRHYVITRRRDGAELMRAHTLGVWVALGTGRPIRIPEDFLRDFAPNLVTAPGD
jgi:acyl-CoA thioester hydrolase